MHQLKETPKQLQGIKYTRCGSTDFERVAGCVGLHTSSTVQRKDIKEKGTHHATIWTISIIMEKFRGFRRSQQSLTQHERNAY